MIEDGKQKYLGGLLVECGLELKYLDCLVEEVER